MDNNYLPLGDDHFSQYDHGDVVAGRIHVGDNGKRYLDTDVIAEPKAVDFKEEDIKSATPVTQKTGTTGGGKGSLEDQGNSLMNSIKTYNKTYYSDE